MREPYRGVPSLSDRRNDESVIARDLRALRDTKGMTDPERTVFWMERVARSRFRGRGDTMGAAIQRTADELGAPVSQAKRCWDRWKEMKSVAGSVMIPFMLAYEDLCQRVEAKADEYERQRLQIRNQTDAVDAIPVPTGAGEGGACRREMAE